MFKIVHSKSKDICTAYRCKNKKKSTDSRFCAKHRHVYTKLNNPLSYVYHTVRSNAKRRGKVFELTIEQFKVICEESGYLENRGRTMYKLTLDRIDPRLGYVWGNVRVITQLENSTKGLEDKQVLNDNNEVPF